VVDSLRRHRRSIGRDVTGGGKLGLGDIAIAGRVD
jgi:hypothetical protein